ncbi:MAG: sulfatase-like hydrolase/transferase, partial [Deltaproteobacteria bacterium]|nr:sulfatase-like hydrolase/transferase [Deltaproteobacteria bacterium]
MSGPRAVPRSFLAGAAVLFGLVDATRLLGAQWTSFLPGEEVTAGLCAAGAWVALAVIGAAALGGIALGLGRFSERLGMRLPPEKVPPAAIAAHGTLGLLSAVALVAAVSPGTRWLAIAVFAVAWGAGALVSSQWASARWAVLLVAAGALGIRGGIDRIPSETAPGGATGPDVVLVTLDTFRADHLNAIGGFPRAVDTPNLDALAARGALFTRGVAPVPLTLPSHAGMLTGRAPREVGVLRNGQALADGARTVAEDFRDAGWRTAAFVSSRVLLGRTGLRRGFQHYDDRFGLASRLAEGGVLSTAARLGIPVHRRSQRRGDRTVDRAAAWLAASEAPAFLWVHLYDPHSPYDPPAPFADRYDPAAPDAPGGPEDLARWPSETPPLQGFRFLKPRDVREAVARYAGEVSWTDAQFGRLLGALGDDAVVVVAADHGESLYEHDYPLNHGARLYEPSIRVPILVRAPEIAPGTRVAQPTSLLRVPATLRALAGLPAGGPTVFDPPDDALLFSFASVQQVRPTFELRRPARVAFREGSTKWIVDAQGRVERYDLATDPEELRDLFDAADPEAAEMAERG